MTDAAPSLAQIVADLQTDVQHAREATCTANNGLQTSKAYLHDIICEGDQTIYQLQQDFDQEVSALRQNLAKIKNTFRREQKNLRHQWAQTLAGNIRAH